jgi:hypothetical protein
MKRICDYPKDTNFKGFRIKSILLLDELGTVVRRDGSWWWVKWDGGEKESTAFLYNYNKNEVVEEEDNKCLTRIV